ncbi:MAG: 6-hydroxymethylpterin diphosphokinase MptE-like protein [Spirochaetaceae bacterium]
MAELFRAKSGDLTASVPGGLLHSRYDPRREAERYLERALGRGSGDGPSDGPERRSAPATVLLLGVGLGYLISAVRRHLPACHLIAVSVLGIVRPEHRRAADVYVDLSAGDPAELLSRAVRPADVAGLEALEWGPELRAAPRAGEAARLALRELAARHNAELATTGFFGRRYIRNAVRNLLFAGRPRTTAPGEKPVCIAASGPGLERACRWIRENRTHIELWALSSAAPALTARGITPDLVVHQDAGYYATLHLAEVVRLDGGGAGKARTGSGPPAAAALPILMPATAALPPGRLRSAPIIFHQGTRIEEELLSALGIEPRRTTETGTVAATATLLALAHSPGIVYLAGLDLCREDIRAHATPHAFEPYLSRGESRLRPFYSGLAADAFDRSVPRAGGGPGERPVRGERSLELYARWFEHLPAPLARRLRRVAPSPVDIGIEPVDPADAPAAGGTGDRSGTGARSGTGGRSGVPAEHPRWEPLPLPPIPQRVAALRAVVAEWKEELRGLTAGHTDLEAAGRASELAYIIAAADYVSAVAAGRRADDAGRARSLRRISQEGERLFARIEHVLDAVAERAT